MARPVSSISFAAAGPMRRGSKYVAPIPGCKPRRTKLAASFTPAAAMRRSHAIAKQRPAPIAGPPITASVGTRSARTERKLL